MTKKREAAERKSRRPEEAERLRKLEENRAVLEEEERERARREVEKIEEMEREKRRRAAEQQLRLADAMEREEKERERRAEQEAERVADEEDERRKKRCRQAMDAMWRTEKRWYYEGGDIDLLEDDDLSREEAVCDELPDFDEVPALDTTDQENDRVAHVMNGRVKEPRPPPGCPPTHRRSPRRHTASDAKPGRRNSERRPKCPGKKSTSAQALTVAGVDEWRSEREVGENLDTSVPMTTTTKAAKNCRLP